MGKPTGLVRIWYQTIKKRVKRKPWMTPKVVLLLLLTNMCADTVQSTCKLKDDQERCDHYFSHYPTSCEDDKDFTNKYCRFTCLDPFDSRLEECVKLKPKCTIERIANAAPDYYGQMKQGQIVTYKCNKGFFPKEGDAVRGCQRDGTLTGRKLLCKAPNNCMEKRFGTTTWDKPVWYHFTNISTVIQSVVVKEELNGRCRIEDFGFSGLGLWVTHWCESIFTVCFEEETKNCPESEKCISKPQDDSPPGNVKQCLHKKLYCDGDNNCNDGMDENCVSACAKHEWQCHDKRKCVKASRVCTDKEKPDCFDGSDEDPEFCFSATTTTAPSRTICKMGNIEDRSTGSWKSLIDGKTLPNNVEDCKQICMLNSECGATSFADNICYFYTKDDETETWKGSVFSKKDCQKTVCTMGKVVENTSGRIKKMIDLQKNLIQHCSPICMADPECGGVAAFSHSCHFYSIGVKARSYSYGMFSKKDCQETECTDDYHKWRRRMHPRKGICIHATKFCNGTGSYSKWDTEVNCKYSRSRCPLDYKKCADYLQCLHEDKFCDGFADCNDRSDEQCEGQYCRNGAQKCSDGKQCLYQDKFCDGQIDCVDQSDEVNCEENTAVETSARALHIVLVMVLAYFIF